MQSIFATDFPFFPFFCVAGPLRTVGVGLDRAVTSQRVEGSSQRWSTFGREAELEALSRLELDVCHLTRLLRSKNWWHDRRRYRL